MTDTLAPSSAAVAATMPVPRRSVPREYLDPPAAWNPTVGLFLAGYGLAGLTIWGWFVGGWPLPPLLALGFLALHLEGTVIHDACHNAAHPHRFWNAVMGHGAALLLGFSFPVFTRVHLQHHAHVNDPKLDPDHIVSTFGPLWLIAPRFFYHEVFFFRHRLWRHNELFEWVLARTIFVLIVVAAAQHNFLPFVFNCWFAPALMVGGHPRPVLRLPAPPALPVPQPLAQRPRLPEQVDELADHGTELSPDSPSLAIDPLV